MNRYIKVKDIKDTVFQDYQKASMFIAIGTCDFKCCKEQNIPTDVCQNSQIAQQQDIVISCEEIYNMYIYNDITEAIVIGGLEPMTYFYDVLSIVEYFREQNCEDDIVIYTGYYPEEIKNQLLLLKQYKNIIVKFGRYKQNSTSRYDEVLGIKLISDNQFAERIS